MQRCMRQQIRPIACSAGRTRCSRSPATSGKARRPLSAPRFLRDSAGYRASLNIIPDQNRSRFLPANSLHFGPNPPAARRLGSRPPWVGRSKAPFHHTRLGWSRGIISGIAVILLTGAGCEYRQDQGERHQGRRNTGKCHCASPGQISSRAKRAEKCSAHLHSARFRPADGQTRTFGGCGSGRSDRPLSAGVVDHGGTAALTNTCAKCSHPTFSMNGIEHIIPVMQQGAIRSQGGEVPCPPCLIPRQSVGIADGAVD